MPTHKNKINKSPYLCIDRGDDRKSVGTKKLRHDNSRIAKLCAMRGFVYF